MRLILINGFIPTGDESHTYQYLDKHKADTTKGYKIRLMLLSGGGQPYVIAKRMKDTDTDVDKGRLRIIKADSDNETIRLNGVKFRIEDKEKGYISNETKFSNSGNETYKIDGEIKYTNDSKEAKIFITGGPDGTGYKGYIDILDIPVGTYNIEETENPKNYIANVAKAETIKVTKYTGRSTEIFMNKALKSLFDTRTSFKDQTMTYGDIYYALTGREYKGSNKDTINATNLVKTIQSILLEPKMENGNYVLDKNGNVVSNFKETYKVNGKDVGLTYKNISDSIDGMNEDDNKLIMSKYIARVYGRIEQGDPNYYVCNSDIKDAYVLVIYTRIWGIDAKEIKNKNYGHLRVIKTEKRDNTKRINDAKYKLYDTKKATYVYAKLIDGEYIVQRDSNGEMLKSGDGITNTFKTGGNNDGYLEIDRLEIGTNRYRLEEVQAPQGYAKAANIENITVRSYARSNERKIEYLKYTLLTLFDQMKNVTPEQKQTFIIYALTGITNPYELQLTSTTTRGMINEIIQPEYKIGEKVINNTYTEQDGIENYTALTTIFKNQDKEQIQEYLLRVYNRFSERVNLKKRDTVDSYILTLYSRCIGYQAKMSEEPSLYGDLRIIKKDANNPDKILNNVGFSLKCKESKLNSIYNNKYVNVDSTGKVSYSFTKQVFMTTNGEIEIKNIGVGEYVATEETVGPNKYYSGNKGKQYTVTVNTDLSSVIKVDLKNPETQGNLLIEKLDKDNLNIKLEGVKFTIKCISSKLDTQLGTDHSGKYVNVNNGEVTYSSTPQEFETDTNGQISIKCLDEGTYNAIETDVGNNINYDVEYTEQNPLKIEVIAGKDYVSKIPAIETLKYINLSGYAWVDEHDKSKENVRNNLYDEKIDTLIQGLEVKLRDNSKNGEIIKTTKTDSNGKYKFERVEINTLKDLYIEFEYNGMTYQTVTSSESKNISKDDANVKAFYNERQKTNTNKFSEEYNLQSQANNSISRYEFNNKFNTIEKEEAISNDGKTKTPLTYNKKGHVSSLTIQTDSNMIPNNIYDSNYLVTANTAGCIIQTYEGKTFAVGTKDDDSKIEKNNQYTNLEEQIRKERILEITNINLGLYERVQPDVRLQKDIYSATVSVNGKSYDYMYNKVPVDTGTSVDTSIGIAFANEHGKNPYKLPIYRADYSYQNPEDVDGRFKTYITYKIALVNEATNIYSVINSIQDTYDSKHMTLVSKRLGNAEGPMGEESSITVGQVQNGDYSTFTLSGLNIEVKPQTAQYIYIKYQLISENETIYDDIVGSEIQNFAEITSYSSYSNEAFNTPYGGVDQDSQPGNLDINKYYGEAEDDSDRAPGLKVVEPSDRTLSGIVFEDSTYNSDINKEIDNKVKVNGNTVYARNGDGLYAYKNKEREMEEGISGVVVTMKSNDNANKTYETTTVSEDGNYGVIIEENSDTGKTTTKLEKYQESNQNKYSTTIEMKKGGFVIAGYIPGENYTVEYTWGAEKGGKQVEDYKATIWTEANKKSKETWGASKWYKNITGRRYSDALDDWNTRLKIDGLYDENAQNNQAEKTTSNLGDSGIKEMVSKTPQMDIDLEYETEAFDKGDYREEGYKYSINNVDFGIIERAKQSLSLIKHANDIKVVLANGQELVNTPIKYENGEPKIENPTKGLTAIGVNKNGVVKYELDSELIQGASIEIGYSLDLQNTSEYDEENEQYYNYGKPTGDVVTLTANKIIDYLDSRLPYSENEGWGIIKESDIGEYKGVQSNYNKPGDIIKEDGTYTYSQILSSTEEDKLNIALKPDGKEITLSNLKFSKLLSNTDDTTFDNLAEIVSITRTGGTVPTKAEEGDREWSETVVVTPPTGENHNYIAIIATTFISLVTLSGGIFLIKKKVIK